MKEKMVFRNRFALLLTFLFSIASLNASISIAAPPFPPSKIASSDSPMQAESATVMDLMEIYRLAQKSDPTFQSERYRHEVAPESVVQAVSKLLPTLSADGYYQETKQKMFNTDVAVYDKDTVKYPSHGYNLTLTQPIFRYPSFMLVKQAKVEVKRADIQFEAAMQDLALRVAEVYIGVLGAFENLEFARAEEEALERHFQLAQARFDSGLAPLTDFHDAKARLAYMIAMRIRAETRLADALEALTEVTGQDIEKIANLKYYRVDRDSSDPRSMADESKTGGESADREMPLVEPDPDDIGDWVNAALKQNLEVQIQLQTLQVAEREIDRQKGRHFPALELVGRINRDDQEGSLFGGSSDIETMEALLQLSVPLYQGGYVSSKVREARKIYLAAKEDLEKEVRRARRETKAAFLGVKSAIKNTEALRHSVLSSQIALEAKNEGYKSGLLPSLVVLDAERDAHHAKREYVRAQYEYILNGLRLKRAVGTLSEADLVGVNRWLE